MTNNFAVFEAPMPNELSFRKIESLEEKRPVFVLVRERSPYIRYAEALVKIMCDS